MEDLLVTLSDDFACKVRAAWGDWTTVAWLGVEETNNHQHLIGSTPEDRVWAAAEVGILVGQMSNSSPDRFIAEYQAYLARHAK